MISLSNKFLGVGLSISKSLYIVCFQDVLGKWMMAPVPSTPLHKREIGVDRGKTARKYTGHTGTSQHKDQSCFTEF